MAHVYCSLAELKNEIMDGGATTLGTTNDTPLLGHLASVSALIDEKMERSAFGSGFGPRTGTNKYDGKAGSRLRLRDDLLTVTSVTIRDSTASSSTTALTADTDYYLLNGDGAYSPGPYRTLLLHLMGVSSFGYGFRVTDIAGTWGYQNVTVTSSTTMSSGFSSSTTATTFTTSATPLISPGMTLLVGTEQMYLSGLSGTTATVVRGVNGTTAAVHADASAIAYYTYPPAVREVCLRLAMRRWKARDAGADGSDSGVSLPGSPIRENEETIIRRGLTGLRLKEMT